MFGTQSGIVKFWQLHQDVSARPPSCASLICHRGLARSSRSGKAVDQNIILVGLPELVELSEYVHDCLGAVVPTLPEKKFLG